ncbi:alpha/beta hydrolase [Methylomonas sp. LWB]|uniref:alpha/beta fold hydrolase n=1 Tax=Methylomonas sp. LWB TaxID=1905845 RepID=UPI0008DA4BC9|nr:alpha/beta hydrolase [Methylomonas sp. LWB]OHX37794.1 alpha/beta hydrolase [Methylomonas sp. LWB]
MPISLAPFRRASAIGRRLAALLLTVVTAACASPSAKLQNQARQFGLTAETVIANGFRLDTYSRSGSTASERLHVYLEGDGRPYEAGILPSADPTTRASVALPLQAVDPAPSLYIARPCYNGHAVDPGCAPPLWTDARYGEIVVQTLADALRDYTERRGFKKLLLIGHSGGGSLALLLAERLPQTLGVVTVAGNYDIDAWTDLHHYQALTASLNPARRPASGLPEWHFLGAADQNIPPALVQTALRRRPNARVEIVDAGHAQGWPGLWPGILRKIADDLAAGDR